MKRPRFAALTATIILSIIAAPACAQKPPDPPEEELQVAIQAFDALGGKTDRSANPFWVRYARVSFNLPAATNDGDLKKLPKVPFSD